MLQRLDTVVPQRPGRPALGAGNPMRDVTRQIAFEPGGWTPERKAKVIELFDALAPEWHTRGGDERATPIEDAITRGGPFPAGPVFEAGAGVGLLTPLLTERFADVVASDLSFEMLRRAPDVAPRVLADASALPLPDRSVAVVVLVNMFLFPHEVDRVLRSDGVVVWVSALGTDTPIYLPADEVAEALPGPWSGVHADAGWGSWATLRRA